MSKQYLTAHVIEDAHVGDIFGLAVTTNYIVTGSGDSNIKLWSTSASEEYKLVHTFDGAHALGSHHVAASSNGIVAASAGFGGEICVWDLDQQPKLRFQLGSGAKKPDKGDTAAVEGVWALALSPSGDRLAASTCDGKIVLWDLESRTIAREYITKGSFGMCIDMSHDGNLVASGHENGGIYIFNNTTGRIHHSLHGLVKPIRSVRFSPGGKLLAAGGDSGVIALFDVVSGEQVANLTGHTAWIFSVAWSSTGEYLLSGSFDGKAKVWSTDTRTCVATHNEDGGPLNAAVWMRTPGVGEGFVTAGTNRRICFYRETSGE